MGERTTSEKGAALIAVASYRPLLTGGVIALSVVAALLEGLGLGFVLPIVEQARPAGTASVSTSQASQLFVDAYRFLGIPFDLGTVVLGVAAVMTLRFATSFLVTWLHTALRTDYVRHLQRRLFESAVDADVQFFDDYGSDHVSNAIVTQAAYAGWTIERIARILQQGLLSLVYVAIAFYLAPMLTLLAGILLGGTMILIRRHFEAGFDVGDRVAVSNERVHEIAQAGTRGIRDVKLYGLAEELVGEFRSAVDQFARSTIKLRRNQAAIHNANQLATVLMIFVLVYLSIEYSSLSLGGVGLYLLAMFRLAPRASALNDLLYKAEGDLPHLTRTRSLIEELETHREPDPHGDPVPEPIETVALHDVSHSYDQDRVLCDVSFSIDRGDFVVLAGPSGAGKSTVVSLLTRAYEPDAGTIVANGIPIDRFGLQEWRSHVSVVRQDPYVFNETIEYNLTVGKRTVSRDRLQRVCDIAQVSEFVSDLPDGMDTVVGDDGVKLSGGQNQRLAIARALLDGGDVLVFDEATSHLDAELTEAVYEGIESMDEDFAVLVIAHRLSTVKDADRIITLEDGEVRERGTHDELIAQQGRYDELFRAQS